MGGQTVKRPKQISYEITPGTLFVSPPGMSEASFRVKAQAQRLAERMFIIDLLARFGLDVVAETDVVPGGWRGAVNPSSQIRLPARTPAAIMRAFASAIGLIWRQDAVAVSRLHPLGRKLAAVLRRVDGDAFTPTQAQRLYEKLYHHDRGKQATIGFFETQGALVFINGGDLSDADFQKTMISLAEQYLADDVYLDLARADFEIESNNWSVDNGESYRERLREIGRSDLLDWIENYARPQAERFLRNFNWKTGEASSQRKS